MLFEWDETKNQSNIEKHGLSFEFAKLVFDDDVITFEDNRYAYGEKRYITCGLLVNRLVVIVHTWRDEHVRIISMRKGNKREQDEFERSIGKT